MTTAHNGNDPVARERRILNGLACEWSLAADELEPHYRQRLARPLFRLVDAPGLLGQWDAVRREICLNRQLALAHPWDDVRDVLRHEMAHQLAESVLGADGQPPHGPAFQQACLMLRADPAAAADRRPLHTRLARFDPSTENPRHAKIRKLLALARSQNPNEAEAAMLKAHELMARHHITTLTHDPRRSFVSIFLGSPALRHFKEAYYLANLLQDFYFVQGIWVPAFVVAKNKMGRVHEISGTPANLTQAEYVYAFVSAYIDRRWSELGAGQRLTRYQKSDFAVGIIEGFRRKLEREQLAADRPSEYALISRSDPRLCTYLRQRYPRTSQIQRGGGRHDPDIYGRGRQIGEQMILHRGIVHRSGDVKHRLPPA
ncbi:MAG: DUF2786 domain-containing protein [Desulfobacterales bacterium]|nr:DUF2786 domain-containing protein [Desulfobacterales bacterium]